MSLAKVLEELHAEVGKDLLAKVKSGEATAAELTAAIRFLQANGIQGVPAPKTPLADLAARLPFAGVPSADDDDHASP